METQDFIFSPIIVEYNVEDRNDILPMYAICHQDTLLPYCIASNEADAKFITHLLIQNYNAENPFYQIAKSDVDGDTSPIPSSDPS